MDEKIKAIKWFKSLMEIDFIIVDTETTGLTKNDEIIEIGILSKEGKEIYSSRIKPIGKISYEAKKVHGITEDDLKDSPTFKEIHEDLYRIINNNNFVGYSAYFDDGMLMANCFIQNMKEIEPKKVFDVMRTYADYWGEWNDYFQNYKWQKLTNACIQQNINVENSHAAIGDCKLTLKLIKKISEKVV